MTTPILSAETLPTQPAFPFGSRKPGSQSLPTLQQAEKACQGNDPAQEERPKDTVITVSTNEVAQHSNL